MENLSVHGTPFQRRPRTSTNPLTYESFVGRLRVATGRCLDVARDYIRDHLPSDVAYWANWNVYNGLELSVDEEIMWPNECRTEGKLLSESSVLNLLWQHARFPRWINTQVDSIEERKTVICLTFSCCFGNDVEETHPNPTCPFVVCSPVPPTEGWQPGTGKFAIADSPGFRFPHAGTGPITHAGYVEFGDSNAGGSSEQE